MIRGVSGSAGPLPLTPAKESDDARLKKTAKQMEGLFVEQLYKAMRETVPQGEGAVDGGTGEDMFTGLMDQHVAAETPTQWAHGLAAAAYKQLRKALPGAQQDAQVKTEAATKLSERSINVAPANAGDAAAPR